MIHGLFMMDNLLKNKHGIDIWPDWLKPIKTTADHLTNATLNGLALGQKDRIVGLTNFLADKLSYPFRGAVNYTLGEGNFSAPTHSLAAHIAYERKLSEEIPPAITFVGEGISMLAPGIAALKLGKRVWDGGKAAYDGIRAALGEGEIANVTVSIGKKLGKSAEASGTAGKTPIQESLPLGKDSYLNIVGTMVGTTGKVTGEIEKLPTLVALAKQAGITGVYAIATTVHAVTGGVNAMVGNSPKKSDEPPTR